MKFTFIAIFCINVKNMFFIQVELQGLTGRIVFDENGMRTNFTVKILALTTSGLQEVNIFIFYIIMIPHFTSEILLHCKLFSRFILF